jgi:diguanylate cyclase (GGDEF)-like protein/PAS domain S-box-containing protein
MTTLTPDLEALCLRFLSALERLPGVRLALVWFDPVAVSLESAPRFLPLDPPRAAALEFLNCSSGWRELPQGLDQSLGLYEGAGWRAAGLDGMGYVLVEIPDPGQLPLPALEALLEAWKAALAYGKLQEGRHAGLRQAARRRSHLVRRLMDQAVVGVYRSNPAGRLRLANAALARILGYPSPEQLLAQPQPGLRFYADEGRRQVFLERLEKQEELHDFESQVRRLDGSLVWVSESVRAVRDSAGRLRWIEGMVMDISRRRAAEEQSRMATLHDPLTGLPNRGLLLDRLTQALRRCRREPSHAFAVLVADLDRLTVVNDSLGHAAGDAVLLAASQRLSALLRPGDSVGRLGGDEFVLMLDGVTQADAAVGVADRLQAALAQPLSLEGGEVAMSACLGLAMGGPHYQSPEHLLRDAATALHRAKLGGPGRCEVFDPSMQVAAAQRLTLELGLRRAVERGEITVAYQPIVGLPQAQLRGFEALARWTHPVLGPVRPDQFITVAEETGLIERLGAQVLELACARAAAWEPYLPEDAFISVNLSALQLRSLALVPQVAEALARHRLAPGRLKLEVTESLLMEDPGLGARVLQGLAGLGCALWMDDFGTGYSSLGMLGQFPFHGVKLDRSFVRDAGSSDKAREMLDAVLALARKLKLQVVAEGVETQEQAALLAQLGCDLGQGYLWSKPLEPADALRRLTHEKLPAAPI